MIMHKLKIVIFILLLSAIAFAQEKDENKATKTGLKKYPSPAGAMLRSLVVPGWGQAYNKQWFKAGLFAAAEIGLITNAIIQNQYKQKATSWAEREYYRNNRSLSLWWLAGVVLYSMGDAYVDAHLYHFDDDKSLSFDMKIEKQTILTSMTIEF